VRMALLNGMPISEAIRATGRFPEVVSNLARVGEQSGNMAEVLADAADYIERVEAIKSAAKRATIYPSFTIVVMLAAIFFWLSVVVPKVAELLKSFNAKLPPETLFLIDLAAFVEKWWWAILVVAISLPIAFFVARSTFVNFRRETDRLGWNLPIVGTVVSLANQAFYFQYLALMYRSGVVITEALSTLHKSLTNLHLLKRTAGVEADLRAGTVLSVSLARTKIFEPLALRMVSVGEETGTLDRQLAKLSEIFYNQVNAKVEVISKVIEPLILVFLGVIFGYFVLAVLGPMYGMIGQMGNN
jgi:type IV pilus assembly protein PilC